MSKTTQPRIVATAETMDSGYRISADYDATFHFNSKVLPFLRELDWLPSTRINDYLNFGWEEACAAFIARELRNAKNDYERELARMEGIDRFRRFMKEHMNIVPKVRQLSKKGEKYTTWNEKTQEFDIDLDAYRKDEELIVAETPAEFKAAEMLDKVCEAINSLHIDQITGYGVSPGSINLMNFIDLNSGKATIKKAIYPGVWKELVKRMEG